MTDLSQAADVVRRLRADVRESGIDKYVREFDPRSQAADLIEALLAERGAGWQPIDTAPEDCRVILATSGNWVGEAIMLRDEDTGEQVWTWVDTGKPSLHSCYGWMPLPQPLVVPVQFAGAER